MEKKILVNGIEIGAYATTGDNSKDIEAVREIIRQKGLEKEVTTNDAMFGQAISFATVAENIYADAFKESPYKGNFMGPFIVNGVFSVEVFLKTIHNAYGNKIKGHRLVELYKNMPNKGKSIFNTAAQDVRPLYALHEEENIISCLEKLSNAFVDWRYMYEKDKLSVEIQSIRYTMHTCQEACIRVREITKNT